MEWKVAQSAATLLFGLAVVFSSSADETVRFGVKPEKRGAVWYPGDAPAFALAFGGARSAATGPVMVVLKDWLGHEVCRKELAADGERVCFEPKDFAGLFGGFEVVAEARFGDETHTAKCWFARLTGPDPKPCRWVGSNTWWLWWKFLKDDPKSSLPYDEVFYDQLTAAGIGRVRYEHMWPDYEPKPGQYADSAAFNEFVDEICRRGIEHHCILAKSNPKAYPDNPLNPEAYARCFAHLAERYKGRINTLEIFNEPQWNGWPRYTFFGGDNKAWTKVMGRGGEDFVKLLWGEEAEEWIKPFVKMTRLASAAARKVNPALNVSVAVMDNPLTLNRMLVDGIAEGDDILSIHPYCHDRYYPEEEWFFRDSGAQIRDLMAKHGGAKRIMISEAGWTTVASTNMTCLFVGYYPKSSYEQQTRYMIRMYLLARQMGVENAMQHNFVDMGPDRYYTEHNFGLVHGDFTPKPVFAAVAYMTRLLGDAEPVGDLSKDPKAYRLYRFEKSGKTVLAAWSVKGVCDVALPETFAEVGGIRDVMGNDAKSATFERRMLHLTENPVYIAVREKRRTK